MSPARTRRPILIEQRVDWEGCGRVPGSTASSSSCPSLPLQVAWCWAERRGKPVQSESSQSNGAAAGHSLHIWPAPRCSSGLLRRWPVCHPWHEAQIWWVRSTNHSTGLTELQETESHHLPTPELHLLVLLFLLLQSQLILTIKDVRWVRYGCAEFCEAFLSNFPYSKGTEQWEGRSKSWQLWASSSGVPLSSRSSFLKDTLRADALPREVFRVDYSVVWHLPVLREGCLFPQQQSFRLLSKVFIYRIEMETWRLLKAKHTQFC